VITTIMVDRLAPCIPNKNWKHKESCHLFIASPEIERLHIFAEGLGLKREWFQGKDRSLPHYDLTASKYKLALEMGAVLVDRYVMHAVMRLFRRKQGVSRPGWGNANT